MCASSLFNATGLSSEHLPTVTLGMLLDFLASYDILAQPQNSRRLFRWFKASLRGTASQPSSLRSGQVLNVCRTSEAYAIIEADESAFICALSSDGIIPSSLKPHRERLIVIRQKDTFSYFLFLLQQFFTDVMMWENELDRIVLRKGCLRELLNVGNSGIDDFMICLDASSNVLACTENVEPPDNIFHDAVKTGRQLPDSESLPPAMPRKPHTLLDKQEAVLVKATAVHPNPQLHFELYVEDIPFATLVLASTTRTISRGTRDLFITLATRAKPLCEALWREQVRIESPYHFFFTRLIEGDIPPRDHLGAYLETMSIPHPAQLKLLLLDLEHAQNISLSAVADAARRINQGDCYCFIHKSKLCILCYATPGDNQLSHEKSTNQLERFVRQPFGIVGSSSQIFENIADLDLAYRQADMAAKLRSLVEKESANDSPTTSITLIPFENCLIYYLVGASDKDERFLAFSFSHTLMQKISAEDTAHGTNYLEIFWQYLACERNATAVAERLHVHRNTVLYRIDKIQKRFEFDLSSLEVREKMIIDFKVFFLMQNRALIQRLFGKET